MVFLLERFNTVLLYVFELRLSLTFVIIEIDTLLI